MEQPHLSLRLCIHDLEDTIRLTCISPQFNNLRDTTKPLVLPPLRDSAHVPLITFFINLYKFSVVEIINNAIKTYQLLLIGSVTGLILKRVILFIQSSELDLFYSLIIMPTDKVVSGFRVTFNNLGSHSLSPSSWPQRFYSSHLR